MQLHYMFRPVISDQHTAARAYFLSVLGMLFIESMLRAPAYLLVLWKKGNITPRGPRRRWLPSVWLHSLLTRPSPVPFLTDHHAASICRCLVFVALNILFGWNRIRYSTDFQIYGWLTIANAGLALLLPTRTNLFCVVARIPASILLPYHRWAGIAAVTHASLHFGLTAQNYIRTNQFDVVLENTRIRVGIMAWMALAIIFLTSVRIVRRRAFELFYYVHFLFLVFVAGGLYHAAYASEFLLPGLCLWVIDRVWRFCYRFRNATVRSVTHHAGDLVKLEVEGVRAISPAQMAWIQLPGVSRAQWHPFTIASAPEEETATFAIRGLGRYTKKVQQQLESCQNNTPKVRVDGPYGVGRLQWPQYPVVAVVAGGIGITPAISIASHMIRRAANSGSRTGAGPWHVYLLWTLSESRHAAWFEQELKALTALASRPDVPVTLDISIHITGQRKTVEECETGEDRAKYNGPGEISQGRPDLTAWLGRIARERAPGLDMALSVCGPQSLKNAARTAAARASSRDGLVYVEEEVFEV